MKEHTNEDLRDLDMGYNEIKDEGICAICNVRRRCASAVLWLWVVGLMCAPFGAVRPPVLWPRL